MKRLISIVVTALMLAAGTEAIARDKLSQEEKLMIMKAVKKELIDPESARFKWVKLVNSVDTKSDVMVKSYCGLVNSKNSYGGYVGDRPYSVTLGWSKGKMDKDIYVLMNSDPEITYLLCAKKGYADFSDAE